MRITSYIAVRGVLYVFLIAIFVTGAYVYKDTYRTKLPMVVESLRQAINPKPCTTPIKYGIGILDERFNLNRDILLKDLNEAGRVWNTALGRNLFVFSTSSPDLTVNLIYDYRQQTTNQLQKLGVTIEGDKASYEALKKKYNSLLLSYQNQKVSLENAVNSYNTQKANYEKEVARWNSQGGAPPAQYEKLKAELDALNAEGARIREQQLVYNELVSTINSTVSILNRLAGQLNLQVDRYNRIGSTTFEEFNEGEYVEDANGKRIDIYQFSDNNQLTRVLMHEFGHALRLEHVQDENAIMHRLNKSKNNLLTNDDINELYRVCFAQ